MNRPRKNRPKKNENRLHQAGDLFKHRAFDWVKQFGKIGLLNVDLQVLRGQLQRQYQILGEKAYQALSTPSKTFHATSKEVEALLKEITTLYKKINHLQQTIQKTQKPSPKPPVKTSAKRQKPSPPRPKRTPSPSAPKRKAPTHKAKKK